MPVQAHQTAEKVSAIAAADVERYVKMRARLVAASEALARATSAESAAAATGSAVVALTGAQHAAVFFRSTNGVVTCPWYHNLSESYVRELITPDGVNPWVHLVRHPELTCMDLPRGGRKRSPAPWLLPDVYELPVRYTVRQRVLREGMRAICSWPLSRGDRTIGAVAYYYDTPHISSEPEQEILRVFASQAAMAVENGITARTARALERSATKAEVTAQPPVRIRAGVEAEAIRLAETLRAQELAVERPALAEGGAPMPAEYRRLADVQATLSTETERLAALQRALQSETQQLADARQALSADATQLEDRRTKLDAAEIAFNRDRQTLEAEAARITTARQELEAARTQLREADTAQTDLAGSEQRRLAEARRALDAEQATFAAAQASHILETDRLAHAQRQIEDERARLQSETQQLAEARQALTADAAQVADARQKLDAARTQLREADTAQTDLAVSEGQRLADARRAVEEERARLAGLEREFEMHEAHLAQERAALSAEQATFAAAQASHARETDRLAQAQRQLEDDRAEFTKTHKTAETSQRQLAAERASLQAESRRLADAQRALQSETQRLADARQALSADAARVADIRNELTAETARLADARAHLNAERVELQDLQTKLEAAETTLSRDRQTLETEAAHITAVRQELEAARTQLREADTAQTDLAVSEQRRLADARRAVEAEQTRLAALQREFEMHEAHLAQERAALSAERASFAAAQASQTLETDRLAQAQRELEDERAHLQTETQQLVEARQALNAERTRLQDLQTELDAAETLSRDRRTLETEAARLTAARQELEERHTPALNANTATEERRRSSPAVVPAPKPVEATYATLVQRIGAPEAEDDDRQIAVVADLLDARNGHAEGFSKCLVGWVEALAHEFSCPEADVQALRRAALLHGIGTINIPESTLQKPSGLTADEQAMLRTQPVVAFRALNDIEWLRPAAAILRRRFERWDGTGDPDRLKGDAIPLAARILAVVDAYAAMVMGRPGITIRPYREAITALKRGAGTHFDPAVVGAFCRIVTRARVGRVATHDAVVELLKDVAANARRFAPANREDEVLQNTP